MQSVGVGVTAVALVMSPAARAAVQSEQPSSVVGQQVDAGKGLAPQGLSWDDLALFAIALGASVVAGVILVQRDLLRLRERSAVRSVAGLPPAGWMSAALGLYLLWTIGGGVAGQAALRLWPDIRHDDLRFSAMVALGAYSAAIVGIVMLSLLAREPIRAAGLWGWRSSLWTLKQSVVGLLLTLPFLWLALWVGSVIEWLTTGATPDPVAHETLRSLRAGDWNSLWWWAVVAGAVVLAPIFEEWLYRGLLQSALRSAFGSRWLAVAGASALFAFAHLGPAGADVRTIAPLAILAIGLGVLFERTGSIWPCVIAHGAFNAINVALALAIP